MSTQDGVNRNEPVVDSVEPVEDVCITAPMADTLPTPTSSPTTQISSFERHLRQAFAARPASTFGAATAPPSYRSGRLATIPPYRAEAPSPPPPTPHRWTTGMYVALLIIFSAQILAVVLCADGSKKLARSPGSAARSPGLAVVLAATAAEMTTVWLLAPIAHRIADGLVLAVVYVLMAAEAIATSGFLFRCVTLDKRTNLCNGAPTGSRHDCENGLAMAMGIGCLRIIVTAPCYLAIFMPYMRRWWPRRSEGARGFALERRVTEDGRTATAS